MHTKSQYFQCIKGRHELPSVNKILICTNEAGLVLQDVFFMNSNFMCKRKNHVFKSKENLSFKKCSTPKCIAWGKKAA